MNIDRILLGWIIGWFCGGLLMVFVCQSQNYELHKQIEQRDSVNTHNAIVIESLREYIRLDSLTQLEQLYPKK